MNHWKTISEETTKRVEAAAAELKYTPNARAVNFARGNTRNIIYLTELKKGEAYSNPHMFDTVFIGGKKNEFISHEREKGFRSFLLRHKHRVTSDHVVYTSSTWQEGYEAAMKILSYDSSDASAAGGNQIPGSIVCENNTIAVGVSRAIKELGLSVPEDVAFLTFDVYPYSTILDPKPEVVEINVYDMGVQAGAMICRKIDNPGLMIQSYITLPEME